ncbi:MAG: C45 family autoproteolytic acyltransferase/hydrolase [Planctomycetota bacterium]|nr:C45 family autoproteolytic acyltransferase/hydrolase [Planctomycetota bacterium]
MSAGWSGAVALVRLRGRAGDRGMTHGRMLSSMLAVGGAERELYLREIEEATRVPRELAAAQSAAWLSRLPTWAQEEIDGMAMGAGVPAASVAEFLYADIATSTGGANSIEIESAAGGGEAEPTPEREILGSGGGCSGIIAEAGGSMWVARNCDWLVATLRRGTAATVHQAPGRHAVLTLGIRGDIDADTAVNERGLWLHLHTLPAPDKTTQGRARFSWLFWAREALETCAGLEELESFIASTERDRGVLVFALEGASGRGALFECSRAGYTRHEPNEGAHGAGACIIATNHRQDRHPRDEARLRSSRRGSTIARYQRMAEILAHGPAGDGPHDFVEILGDPWVEMREAAHLRTIYSAVASPGRREVWFAHGDHATRAPAASSGTWRRIEWPFER